MTKAAIIAAIAAIAAGPGLAADLTHWGEAGDWEILVDPTNGNGCLMQRELEDGTIVQFGAVPNLGGGFFAAYNPEWKDLEDGATNTVKFDFPDKRFAGEAETISKDGKHGGYAYFDNANVPLEFAKNNEMKVLTENKGVLVIPLKGTSNAIKAVKQCQDKQ